MTDHPLAHGLERYLSQRWSATVAVSDIRRMTGGAARTTWRCTASAGNRRQGLVFRLSGEEAAALHLSGDMTEYAVVKAAFDAGIPVPEPLFIEEDPQWLGTGFVIMAEIPDCSTTLTGYSPAQRETLAHDLWSILGRIAALDLDGLGIGALLEPVTPERCARVQLDHWAAIFRDSLVHPDPVGEAAIRWMEANMPPPAQRLALVHGDYRVGNLLLARNGRVRAVLDWEMTHCGDPLEDLAWSLDPRHAVDEPELAGGLIPYLNAIEIWKETSGFEVDSGAFRWWQVLVAFKALAIWTKSAGIYDALTPKRPVLARLGSVLAERQRRVLADYLSPHSARRLFEYKP